MLSSWALSIGLTLFLAKDNANLQKDKKKNMLVSVSAMQPCPYFFISLPLLRE